MSQRAATTKRDEKIASNKRNKLYGLEATHQVKVGLWPSEIEFNTKHQCAKKPSQKQPKQQAQQCIDLCSSDDSDETHVTFASAFKQQRQQFQKQAAEEPSSSLDDNASPVLFPTTQSQNEHEQPQHSLSQRRAAARTDLGTVF